jgi:hypothetical protein
MKADENNLAIILIDRLWLGCASFMSHTIKNSIGIRESSISVL